MFLDKSKKYRLDYTPDIRIPRGLLAYVWMVVKRNPVFWAIQITCDVLHAVRYPIAFLLVGHVIDLITTVPSLPEGAPIPDEIWLTASLIFLVLFIGEMCHVFPIYVTFEWWNRSRAELRSDLFAYTLKHSYTYFQNHFAGSLARKVTEGIEKALRLGEQVRWQIVLPLTVMTTSGIALFSISVIYGLFVLAFVSLVLLPVFLKLKKLTNKSRIFADRSSDVTGQIVDTLTNMASVKSYAHEEREIAEHKRVSENQMKAWHKLLRTWILLDNYRRATLVMFGGGMMMACLYGYQIGVLSLGNIATIMGLAFSFTGNAWHISNGIINVMESLGTLNDSLTTLIVPHKVQDKDDAKTLRVSKGHIAFKDVDFQYTDKGVFKGLNLDIPARQKIGFIGHSGAGKSTLINLIQRFYDVSAGSILIDGQDIEEVSQSSLRQSIAVIPQDTSLFHRTIMENIRYGRLDASDEDVRAAAEQAFATEFIDELPDGFETFVGERGVKLSGGQRQRIAIARAILKDAPILILDEATSALDSESEKQIQEALKTLMDGKTVIAIAHRLSTIHTLDRLIVMEDGKIVEDGEHEALIANKGTYQRLWDMQSGGFLPPS
ncbi:MAG: ABC transporter ATP-binding protein [Pseudomonadota bacterium]